MAEAGLLLNRALDDSNVHPDKLGAPLVLGEIASVAWVSAANPTLEVLDQSTAQLVSVNAIGCTLDLTNGTIAAPRDGLYRAKLVLSQVSAASASGVMEFFIQKNSAAMSQACSTKLLQPAVAANFMSASCERVLSLVKGDLIRVVVTGTVGGVITVTTGTLSLEMLGDDLDNVTQV